MAKNVLEEIYAKYDLNKDEDVLALYRALQSGEYDLNFPHGKELDDEVYDKAMEIKARNAVKAIEGKSEQNSKKKKQKNKQDKQNNDRKREQKSNARVVVLTKGQYRFRKMISVFLFLLAIGCLGYFSLYCMDAYQTRMRQKELSHLKSNEKVNAMYEAQSVIKKNEDTGEEKRLVVLDEYKSLYSQNKNLIGWLKIADTNIDYPVMQTKDNAFYLNHDIHLNEDKNGCLFLDASCDVVKPSTNFIIYGHNMRSGNMFGGLSKFKEKSYYEKHPQIEFDSIYEKGTYQIVFAFTSHIYAEDEIAFKYYQFIDAATKKEFDSNISAMRELSLYDTQVNVEYGDQLITLSTCDYDQVDGRFVVVGKRIR